jgi:hypothetical protein
MMKKAPPAVELNWTIGDPTSVAKGGGAARRRG